MDLAAILASQDLAGSPDSLATAAFRASQVLADLAARQDLAADLDLVVTQAFRESVAFPVSPATADALV